MTQLPLFPDLPAKPPNKPPPRHVNLRRAAAEDLPELEQRYQLLVATWVREPEPPPEAIRIAWDDELDADE